jgi:hypothetical protein
VLAFCADAGLVGLSVLAVGGTKLPASGSQHQNLARAILAETDAVDRAKGRALWRPARRRAAARAVDGAGPARLAGRCQASPRSAPRRRGRAGSEVASGQAG